MFIHEALYDDVVSGLAPDSGDGCSRIRETAFGRVRAALERSAMQ
jgi:hypothetical protein